MKRNWRIVLEGKWICPNCRHVYPSLPSPGRGIVSQILCPRCNDVCKTIHQFQLDEAADKIEQLERIASELAGVRNAANELFRLGNWNKQGHCREELVNRLLNLSPEAKEYKP